MFQPLWKNMSQNGNLPQIGVTIKNIWNHHPVRIHGIPGLKALLFWRVQASNIDSLDGSETIGFWGPSPFVTSAPQKIRLHKKSREGLRGHESTTPKKRWSKYARVASTYESLDSLMAKVKFLLPKVEVFRLKIISASIAESPTIGYFLKTPRSYQQTSVLSAIALEHASWTDGKGPFNFAGFSKNDKQQAKCGQGQQNLHKNTSSLDPAPKKHSHFSIHD